MKNRTSLKSLLLALAYLASYSSVLAGDASPASSRDGVGSWNQEFVESDWVDADGWFTFVEQQREEISSERLKSVPQPITTSADAAGGCDGVKTGSCGFHTASGEIDPWWQVDLGRPFRLDRVVVYNRTDGKTASRTKNIRLLASKEASSQFKEVYRHDGGIFGGVKENGPLVVELREEDVTAQVIRLMVPGRCSFALDEVEVYPADDPNNNIALGRPADQKSTGPYSKAERPSESMVQTQAAVDSRPDTSCGGGFQLEHTRRVIARGQRLVTRLKREVSDDRLACLAEELETLDRRVDGMVATTVDAPEDVRKALYLSSRRLVRQIAFTNPRLDFDKILFVKRHDPGGLYHMVHQYYGFCQKPGGGLFVLHHPFSDRPSVSNLLANTEVEQGRLKGGALAAGAFLAPEVSFDGRQILFAFTEGGSEGIEWSPRASFHIFRVNADGGGLVQLTDGPWNDFDPCFLPGGRIVFVSERRGGYLRCGGSAPPYDSPTYTLHSMEPDGSDICCLSYHETHEWHPSVDHDGKLVYTRWDYVDRDTNVAHHIWSCYPDGRDPRSFHGNYPATRESRPWMEMSCRAVPDSNRYVATAAAHHGLAFGSLVLVDYRPEDDGALSQIERITEDAPFPESEGGKKNIRQWMCYGTAWPLGEDDYLCVYDRHAQNRGIYWIDRDGNRELLYRDPDISCLSPIPLRPRSRPPAIPERTTQTRAAQQTAENDRPATITVMNVYDSDFTWPANTKIKALRVIQVLPKTTPPVDQPRIGIATETNARMVLGTAPVEEDGSVFFEAPVGKPIYFQAIDERGLAVQSMRSATYVHRGEQLVCGGCHEPKRQTIGRRQPSLATLRAPSPLDAEPEGSHPFNYPRLVQPVLDRHCVACHRQRNALDLSGTLNGPFGWSRSYANLAPNYGFYFTVGNGTINKGVHGGARTTAGQFGAGAAGLMKYLDPRHYGVRLPPEDLRRITLWLDCNSEFYGAYEDTPAQARGEVVMPRLE